MNWLVAKLTGAAEPEAPSPERPPPPTPQFVLRRKLVYVHSFSQTALLLLAAGYTLHFLRDVLVPITLAVVLYLALSPALRALERVRVPTSLAAALLVLAFMAAVGSCIYALSASIAEWAGRLPYLVDDVAAKIETLRAPVEEVAKASEQVEKIANGTSPPGGPPEVVVRGEGLKDRIVHNAIYIAGQAGLVVVLLYFLLATGAIFREKLIKAMPTFGDKRRAFAITQEIQKQVSIYLATVALINIGLGAAIGAALFLVGMPSAFLWGAMAAIVNFVPFLGAMVGIGITAIVALISYDSLTQALIPPLLYLALASIEGQFISPSILGRRLSLNPLVIVLAVVVVGWVWGVVGALLAVPLLVILKAICDNVEPLAPIGEFLGGRRP